MVLERRDRIKLSLYGIGLVILSYFACRLMAVLALLLTFYLIFKFVSLS